MNGFREGVKGCGLIVLAALAVAMLVGIWWAEYAACRSKHPEAAPWACAVNP